MDLIIVLLTTIGLLFWVIAPSKECNCVIKDLQPKPIPNNNEPVVDVVMRDLQKRKELGIERYGVALQPRNGRDALLDAYEESLDMTIYLKQAILERDMNE